MNEQYMGVKFTKNSSLAGSCKKAFYLQRENSSGI